jgi:Flp pilus assembly protein TadG
MRSSIFKMAVGLVAVVIVGTIFDLSRWYKAREQTIAAIDAGVLASASALKTGASEPDARTLALRYYQENTKKRHATTTDTLDFVVSENGTVVSATGSAHIETLFLRVIGLRELPLLTSDELPKARVGRD